MGSGNLDDTPAGRPRSLPPLDTYYADSSSGPEEKSAAPQRKKQRRKKSEVERDESQMEHHLQLFENAKKKAEQEKEERRKFLEWKVRSQRKERKQREKEEKQNHERMEKQMEETRRIEKERKAREAKQWSAPKPPPPQWNTNPGFPARMGASAGSPKPWGQAPTAMSMTARSPVDTSASIGPLSSPPRTTLFAPKVTESVDNQHRARGQNGTSERQGGAVQTGEEGSSPDRKAATQNPFERIRDRTQLDEVLNMTMRVYDGQMMMMGNNGPEKSKTPAPPGYPDPSGDTMADEVTTASLHKALALLPPPPTTLAPQPIEKKRRKLPNHLCAPPAVSREESNERAAKVQNMYDKALKRRNYAAQRMMEDPPVDYQFDGPTDLLRYIPAEFLDQDDPFMKASGVSGGATLSDRTQSDFFLTAVDEATVQESTRRPHIGKKLHKVTLHSLLAIPKQRGSRHRSQSAPAEITSDEERRRHDRRLEEFRQVHDYIDHVEEYSRQQHEQSAKTYNWKRKTLHTLPRKDLASLYERPHDTLKQALT